MLPLFLSPPDYYYNAALRLCGPPAMFVRDIVPPLPANAVTETNRETLGRLRQDLSWSREQFLSAGDTYRFYGHDECGRPFWGYLLETAGAVDTRDIFVLVRSNDERTGASMLRWVPMYEMYTRKHAHLRYKVVDTESPTEEVMIEILQLLCEVFEYAVDDDWSYEKRMEFYHAFPFDEFAYERGSAGIPTGFI